MSTGQENIGGSSARSSSSPHLHFKPYIQPSDFTPLRDRKRPKRGRIKEIHSSEESSEEENDDDKQPRVLDASHKYSAFTEEYFKQQVLDGNLNNDQAHAYSTPESPSHIIVYSPHMALEKKALDITLEASAVHSGPSLSKSTLFPNENLTRTGRMTKSRASNFSLPFSPSQSSDRGYQNDMIETKQSQKLFGSFKCGLCPKRFTRAYNLASHLRTHKDERPFICSLCGKAFARHDDRRMHEVSHSTVPPEIQQTNVLGAREEQMADIVSAWPNQADESGWQSDYEDDGQPSRTVLIQEPNITQPEILIEPYAPTAPVPSDSGYHSGLGTDTGSVCSFGSTGSSLGIPVNFLHNFIVFFGDMLIKKSGVSQWAEHALTQHSSDDIEAKLMKLLKEYAVDLASNASSDLPKNALSAQNSAHASALIGAASLIRRYRPKIAQYFCQNAISPSDSAVSMSERLQFFGKQLSVIEKFGLFAKPAADPNGHPGIGLDTQMGDEDDEIVANLELVQELLVSCSAFDRLTLSLRQALHYDNELQMENVRTWVLGGLQKTASTSSTSPDEGLAPYHLAGLHVNWPIAGFMCSQYGNDYPNIGAVVVLTGSSLYAQATTCAEYVKMTWPNNGPVLLELLNEGLSKLRQEHSEAIVHLPFADTHPLSYQFLQICVTPSANMSITVQGTEKAIIELAQLVCWIGSALNTSAFGEKLAYAKPVLGENPSGSKFHVSFTHQPLQDNDSACWLPLFCGATIAHGFPVLSRGNEMGLEIPLELLAGIAGASHMVEYEGGVVIKSFSHMFIPIRREQDRVQWHVISGPDPDTRLTYHDALSRCKDRVLLEELNLDDLSKCRAFVGWCSVATSKLGSELANFENIDYSGAVDADSDLRCAGGSLGFQQFGMASLDFKLGAKDGKCHFQRNGPYQRIVSAADKTSIALYDKGEQRAWLVPASGVMLHIAQHRHWLEPFTINGRNIKLDTSCSPDCSAKDILLKNASLRLSDFDEYTFKDMILNIWSLLEFLVDQNVVRDRNKSGTSVKATLREYLYGFEYKAVVEERSPLRLKQTLLAKTHGGWPQFVRDIDALVLLADGFEDIIVPVAGNSMGLCRNWQRLPTGEDYMATSTSTLKDLYDVAGCRLNRKYLTSTQLAWHKGDSLLFEDCKQSRSCQCNRLQQIIPKSAIGTIISPDQLVDGGAVIFGCSRRSMRNALSAKARSAISNKPCVFSQPNIPLQSFTVGQPSDQSNVNSFGDSFDTRNSSPGSLSSCTTASMLEMDTEMSPRPRIQFALPETDPETSDKTTVLEPSSDLTWQHADNFERQFS